MIKGKKRKEKKRKEKKRKEKKRKKIGIENRSKAIKSREKGNHD